MNGKIHHMEKSVLFKRPYYPGQSTESMQSYQNTNGSFYRTRTNTFKTCMELKDSE